MPPAQSCTRSLPADQVETDPRALRWGVVSTIKAPLRDITRFAAWHLDLGAAQIDIYLDAPDPQTFDILSAHPRLKVTACDDHYWQGKREKARSSHQLRQTFNASRSYRRSRLDWLAHIDVDEFLIANRPWSTLLVDAPADCACLHLPPVEQLSGSGDTAHFKRTRKAAQQPPAVMHDMYPEFGDLLPQGFISYTGQKIFARVGLENIRFGIHKMLSNGMLITNRHLPQGAFVGHAHAPNFVHFQRYMAYRMAHGSYRNQENGNARLHKILSLLRDEPDDSGLRRLYTEYCTARPELLDLLRAHDMLVSVDMGLDARVSRHFGPLPPEPEETQ